MPVDAFGRVAALGDGGDGEVVAARGAVAAGPDFRQRGAALGIDLDLAAGETDALAIGGERLADRLEHLVAGH
jgi:hypothetical protein